MKSKMIKVMSLSIVLVSMLAVVAMPVMAGSTGTLEMPQPDYNTKGTKGISNAGGNIAGIASTIGIAVAIVILIWLAIKYITAAPSDKADIKKSAVAYVIGAVLLFAASGVLALIQSFATEMGNSLQEGSAYEVRKS